MTFLLTFLELSNIFVSPLSYRLIDTETALFKFYRRNIYSVIPLQDYYKCLSRGGVLLLM
jgi:hypothetical protein